MTEPMTLVDMIASHVDDGNFEEAEQLALLGEYLEDCFHWELSLYPEEQGYQD